MQMAAEQQGLATPEYVCSLSGHTKVVNVVRFSPTGVRGLLLLRILLDHQVPTAGCCAGTQLVSGGDGGELYLWERDLSSTEKPWRRQHVCRCSAGQQARPQITVVI